MGEYDQITKIVDETGGRVADYESLSDASLTSADDAQPCFDVDMDQLVLKSLVGVGAVNN